MAAEVPDFDDIWILMLNPDKTNFQRAIEANPALIHLSNRVHMTLLHFAARNGDWPAIKILLDNGADLADKGGPGTNQTAFHFAVTKSPTFAIALAVWVLRRYGKDFIALVGEILKDNMLAYRTALNLIGEDFLSLLLQTVQQMHPETTSEITKWKNAISSQEQLMNALISLSEQKMLENMALSAAAPPLLSADSPIINHGVRATAPLEPTADLFSNRCKY